MRRVYGRAWQKVSKNIKLYVHVAIVLVVISLARGQDWTAALLKVSLLFFGFMLLYVCEVYKAWRAFRGLAFLEKRKLWVRFYLVIAIIFSIYIAVSLFLAIEDGERNSLGMPFPIVLFCVAGCGVVLYRELKELSETASDGDVM